MHAGLFCLEGALAALVHSSHNEERQRLLDIQAQQGTKAYLEKRATRLFSPNRWGPALRGVGTSETQLKKKPS